MINVKRRELLMASAGGLLLKGRGATAGTSASEHVPLRDPVAQLTALLRLIGRLDGRDAPWWYFGQIYGVVEGMPPRPLVRFQGLEITRLTPTGRPLEYAATGTTTSYFEDRVSMEPLDRFLNPYTGKENTVMPNQLGGTSIPAAYYSAEGVRPGLVDRLKWQPNGLGLNWEHYGDMVWMSLDRVFPPGLPQPLGESTVTRARLQDLNDVTVQFVPAGFSSTYWAPWPHWMHMQDHPGHVIWHAEGLKLPSVDALPDGFLARMRSQFPDRLAAPPFKGESS